MTIDDELKTASTGVALVGALLKVAGENPNAKEAGGELGKTVLTLTKLVNNALLPLAAVNFAFDRFRVYFSETFQKDITEKTASIPSDQIIEPKASIAGPALQGLAFSHEEANLKNMYLSLLATAMDARVANEAHPAFVEIIKQLNAEEAQLIGGLLALQALPIVEIRLQAVGTNGWKVLETHLLNLTDTETSSPSENPRTAAMVDNWVRLGLVHVDYVKLIDAEGSYDWVEGRPEVMRYKTHFESETVKVIFAKGVIVKTALGIQFAKAVGLMS